MIDVSIISQKGYSNTSYAISDTANTNSKETNGSSEIKNNLIELNDKNYVDTVNDLIYELRK